MSDFTQIQDNSGLEFQEFDDTQATAYSKPVENPASATPSAAYFWNLEYYKPFFDVDSIQVGERILATIVPAKDFFGLLTPPDLYGPFWIPTTVVFALFASTTITQSLVALFADKPYTYDLTLLSWSLSAVYSFVMFIPAIIWGFATYYKIPLKLLELLDLYGYGMTIWIPVSFLCIIPNEIVKWIIVITAFVTSTLFKVRNLQPVLQNNSSMVLVLGFVTAAQAGLAILFKFVFFSYVSLSPATGTPS